MIGNWGKDKDSESSNFRELKKVVTTLGEKYNNGKLEQYTLIMVTNNSTVEGALYKGNSASIKCVAW